MNAEYALGFVGLFLMVCATGLDGIDGSRVHCKGRRWWPVCGLIGTRK